MWMQLPYNLESTYFESSSSTPLFFILFPGADPVKVQFVFSESL